MNNPISFEQAVALLTPAVRMELRDHAFGDAEIYFFRREDVTIENGQVSSKEGSIFLAEGYNGKNPELIVYHPGTGETAFIATREQAVELLQLGQAFVERNDSTGPDEFVPGACMPGLTLEGVRDELINAGVFVRKDN